MQRLLRNKKGTVIGDFFSGISSTIGHFLTSAPKPLLIIIFLAFLLFFSVIFSFFLNTTGNFCDTAGNEYKTGTFNLIGNIGLLSSMPSEEEIDNEYISVEGGFFQENFWYDCSNLYYNNSQYKNDEGEWVNFGEERYYYIGTDQCVYCEEEVRVRPDLSDEGFFYSITYGTPFKEKICLDSLVYPKEYDDLSWYGKNVCGKVDSVCSIPTGYYFDGNNNIFVCGENECLSENGTNTIGQAWNLKLKGQGARLTPPSQHGDRDYRNALRIECDNGDLNPKLRVFGVNPFDYRLWIFLVILSALVWVMFKIKRR